MFSFSLLLFNFFLLSIITTLRLLIISYFITRNQIYFSSAAFRIFCDKFLYSQTQKKQREISTFIKSVTKLHWLMSIDKQWKPGVLSTSEVLYYLWLYPGRNFFFVVFILSFVYTGNKDRHRNKKGSAIWIVQDCSTVKQWKQRPGFHVLQNFLYYRIKKWAGRIPTRVWSATHKSVSPNARLHFYCETIAWNIVRSVFQNQLLLCVLMTLGGVILSSLQVGSCRHWNSGVIQTSSEDCNLSFKRKLNEAQDSTVF